MTRILIICLSLFSFTTLCQAQSSVEIDERLTELYSPDQLKHLKESNPQLLERLNFYLDHAFIITDQNQDKPTEFQGEVIIKDLEHFNILKLEKEQDLKRSWDTISVYKIKGTDRLFVYHSGRNFNRDFQNHYRKIQ